MSSKEPIPATDEELLDEVIAEYLRELESGSRPDKNEWLEKYPQLRRDLEEFFNDHDQFGGFVEKMHEEADSVASVNIYDQPTAVPYSSETTPDEAANPLPVPYPHDTEVRYAEKLLHARGGMGEIWAAHDIRVGRRVAVKRLSGMTKERQDRFFAEARITGLLEHPSIVPMHDVGIDKQGRPYYVMAFVQGDTLRDRLREYHRGKGSPSERNLQLRQLLKAFVDVCHAVAFAHSKGVLHRDLKPANVMIGAFGETLVLDWGLAKKMDDTDAPVTSAELSAKTLDSVATQDGAILGSPAYMSPEAATGNTALMDHRADIFLLGATLYEILTGVPPRKGGNPYEILEQVLFESPPPPRSLVPTIDKPLNAICCKAMAPSPEQRYGSALDLAEDLERFLAGEPVFAYDETFSERAFRWCKRNSRNLRIAAMIVLVFVACSSTYFSLRETGRLQHIQQLQAESKQFEKLAEEARFFAASVDSQSETVPYYAPNQGVHLGLGALKIADGWGAGFEQLPEPLRQIALDNHFELVSTILQTHLHHPLFENDEQREVFLSHLRSQPNRGEAALQLERLYASAPGGDDITLSTWTMPAETATDYFLAGENYRLLARNPDNPTFSELWANKHKQLLNHAVENYQHVLKIKPDHYWALLQLGRCYIGLDRANEATAILHACITLRPDAPWGYLARTAAFLQMQQYKEALDELDTLKRVAPDFEPAKIHRAVALMNLNDLETAESLLRTFLDKPSFKATASFYLGDIYLRRGEYERAHAAFEDALLGLVTPRIVHRRLAESSILQGNFEQGLTELDAQNAGMDEISRHRMRADFLRGIQLRSESRTVRNQLAQWQFRELTAAMEKGAESASLLLEIGSSFERLGRLPDAVAAYDRGLTIDPANEKLRLQRAWCHVAAGALDQALIDFETVYKQRPDSAEANTGIGYVKASQSEVPESEDAAIRAVLHAELHYLILHNVACIYAKLSQTRPEDQQRYLNLAMETLRRAVTLWEREGRGQPDELALIRNEPAFGANLRTRADFKSLLGEKPPPLLE